MLLVLPVSAVEYTAPEAPASAQKYMPDSTESFADGLWYVIRSALEVISPSLMQAAEVCLSVIAAVLITSLIENFTAVPKQMVALAASVCIGILLFRRADSLLQLGTETVQELSDYGKLLFPVLTAATAANGAATTSVGLYTGTMLFTAILSTMISKCIVPLTYIYMAVSVADSATAEQAFKGLKGIVKWVITWGIKIVLYVFTGFMSITGVISGSVDAAAVKAAKLAISGAVPVVGSVLSDASETILVSAGIMKNAAGVYGLLAVIAACIGPFLRIGVHYLMIKLTYGICSVFGSKSSCELVKDMSVSMGLILAMTGTVCLLLLIGIVCYIRSVV